MVRKAGYLCFDDSLEKILVVCDSLSDTGKHGVPKGHMEEGETIFACANRELAEETGLEYIPQTRGELPTRTLRFGDTNLQVVRVQGCDQPLIQDTNEVARVFWCPISQLQMRDCNRVLRLALDKLRAAKRLASENPGELRRIRRH